ncbi:MAG: TIM barrel protein [Planctomycetes bacterium]|nr:TIM barrel protein [Planctomycetota bacterium]
MLKFSAHLSFLYQELPLLQRIEAAGNFGFKGVECMFPYEEPADTLRKVLDDRDMEMVLINAPAGDWAGGERGLAVLSGREQDFTAAILEACTYAVSVGIKRINVLSGIANREEKQDVVESRLVERLRYAADIFVPHGIDLLLEPINPMDIKGFFVTTPTGAIRLLDKIARDNVKLQYDIYHAQRTEGELAGFIRSHLPRIGHIQIADNPGRHEPGTGEINYRFLLGVLERLDYAGWVGLEYKPSIDTAGSLSWLGDMGYVLQ